MQHLPQVLFCDECGLANDPAASHCVSCQHSLTHASSALNTSPVAPIAVAPPPVLEVTPGPLLVPGNQGARALSYQYPTCNFRSGSILAERYQIQEEIGSGGFSVVYRAVDLDVNHREVAIKRIQLSALTPRQTIDATETFNREITMLVRFKGIKGIPRFYEHLIDAENWYLIMQYIPGQTLEDYLQKAPGGYLSEEETIELGITLSQIMQELHEVNPPVIFRDVKPANIMITPQRGIFLIDFGIARNFTPGKTKDTTPLGSPGYAPPEQYGRSQTSQRSDIYSLGATLQTMLTGRDPLELRAGEPSRNPKPPSRPLRNLLNQMLSPTAARRPSEMRRIRLHLERARQLPIPSYVVGLTVGVPFSAIMALDLFTSFGRSIGGGLVPLFTLAINLSLRFVKKKFGVKNVKWFSWLFALLGALTGLLLLLLIWLWHTFGWPI